MRHQHLVIAIISSLVIYSSIFNLEMIRKTFIILTTHFTALSFKKALSTTTQYHKLYSSKLFDSLNNKTTASSPIYSTTKMFSTIEKGAPNSSSYRLYIKNDEGKVLSPFHDIPLISSPDSGSTYYNMVVEIPRWSNAKMEIATKEPMNPIKQDSKNGKLRYVHNCFPYHGYIWNYGALPQTWENPDHEDPNTKAKGDNDPIDVCEIGSQTLERGQVVPVKVLGVLALIDVGETDWKLIVIKSDDPLAEKLNDIADIESLMPGLLKATHQWFEIYKIPDGKPANQFGFNGEIKGAEFAKKIIQETHEQWKALIYEAKSDHPLALENISQDKSPFKVSTDTAADYLKDHPEFQPPQALTTEEADKLTRVSYVRF